MKEKWIMGRGISMEIIHAAISADENTHHVQTTQSYLVCMGMYEHPFKDMQLCGPYWYTDGEYFWDRDA